LQHQILGCELHQNAFGGQALLGPAGGAIVLPRPCSRYYWEGKNGKEMVENRKGGKGGLWDGQEGGRERR